MRRMTRRRDQGSWSAGVGYDGRGYVFADESGRYRPEEWAQPRRDAYATKADSRDRRRAMGRRDGGERAPLRRRRWDAVRIVHAKRGKATRAGPVAVL